MTTYKPGNPVNVTIKDATVDGVSKDCIGIRTTTGEVFWISTAHVTAPPGLCNCDGEWFQEHVSDCPTYTPPAPTPQAGEVWIGVRGPVSAAEPVLITEGGCSLSVSTPGGQWYSIDTINFANAHRVYPPTADTQAEDDTEGELRRFEDGDYPSDIWTETAPNSGMYTCTTRTGDRLGPWTRQRVERNGGIERDLPSLPANALEIQARINHLLAVQQQIRDAGRPTEEGSER